MRSTSSFGYLTVVQPQLDFFMPKHFELFVKFKGVAGAHVKYVRILSVYLAYGIIYINSSVQIGRYTPDERVQVRRRRDAKNKTF